MNISNPSRFPPPTSSDEHGVVSVGHDLSLESLVDAYSHGIFPWPHKNLPLLWFSPEERGVLFFSELHIPQSFKKWLKKTTFSITYNKSFKEVMSHCAQVPRAGQSGESWVTAQMKQAYLQLHEKGLAHSVECWDGGELVGGLYGVLISGAFSAESMFYLKTGASKFCLYSLILHLKAQGLTWIDTQMVTDVVESFGARYIPRDEFLKILSQAQKKAAGNPISL